MKKSASVLAQELLAQHRALQSETSRLLRIATATEMSWREVDIELAQLDHTVTRHFALEEDGGYLSDVRKRLPNESQNIERLAGMHRELAQRLRELRHLVIAREDAAKVRTALTSWLAMLSEHEAAENRLVQMAYNTELASID